MKKVLKWAGIVLAVSIALMMLYSVFGLKQTLNLNINAIDLTRIPDGSYYGSYDSYRWSNTVEVTVKDHQIIGIQPIKIQDSRDDMVKELTLSILSLQTNDVDVITGATASSNGFLKAVENALESAVAKSAQ